MDFFLDFLATHRIGLVLAVVLAVALAALVQWFIWMFGKGRFKENPQDKPTSPLRFVIADFLVRLINDFRHLLALALLLVFAATLAAVFTRAADFAQVKEGLQVVMATLGGLLGSIIGYYFGESAVRRSGGPDPNPGQPAVPIPLPAGPPTPAVPAPNPPVPAPNPPVPAPNPPV